MFRPDGANPNWRRARIDRAHGTDAERPGRSDVQHRHHRATPHDVTLQELHVEVFYPADAETEAVLKVYEQYGK